MISSAIIDLIRVAEVRAYVPPAPPRAKRVGNAKPRTAKKFARRLSGAR